MDKAGFMATESWHSGDNDGHSQLATWAFFNITTTVATAQH